MKHIKRKAISRVYTTLFSKFHFKIELPSKENELRDLNNIQIENHFKMGALMD